MSLKIYGASDDLIEFEGDLNDEFGCYDAPVLIILSDATVLEVCYDDDGIWRFKIRRAGPLFARLEMCVSEDDDPHSDVAHFGPGITWAYVTKEWELIKK